MEIDEELVNRLEEAAARTGRSVPELVEAVIRALLHHLEARADLTELPSFHGGRARVDLADRDALYRTMEEE
jgi:hypothetical protein